MPTNELQRYARHIGLADDDSSRSPHSASFTPLFPPTLLYFDKSRAAAFFFSDGHSPAHIGRRACASATGRRRRHDYFAFFDIGAFSAIRQSTAREMRTTRQHTYGFSFSFHKQYHISVLGFAAQNLGCSRIVPVAYIHMSSNNTPAFKMNSRGEDGQQASDARGPSLSTRFHAAAISHGQRHLLRLFRHRTYASPMDIRRSSPSNFGVVITCSLPHFTRQCEERAHRKHIISPFPYYCTLAVSLQRFRARAPPHFTPPAAGLAPPLWPASNYDFLARTPNSHYFSYFRCLFRHFLLNTQYCNAMTHRELYAGATSTGQCFQRWHFRYFCQRAA